MGATIALWLGRLYPDKYQKIVAIAPAAGKELIPSAFRGVKKFSSLFNWSLNQTSMEMILKYLYANESLVTPDSVEGYLKPYLENKSDSIQCFINAKNLIQDARLPKELTNLQSTPLILSLIHI